MRGADCLPHLDLLQRSDAAVRATLDRILDQRSGDIQWAQACLPLRHGGLGLRSCVERAGPARVAALLNWLHHSPTFLHLRDVGSLPLDGADLLLSHLRERLGPSFPALAQWPPPGDLPNHRSQAWWTHSARQMARPALLQSLGDRDLIRIEHQNTFVSSAWMVAPPCPVTGTTLDPFSYRALLKWHLGMPLIPVTLSGTPCPLGCGQPLDPFGDHIVCCNKNKLWQRHRNLQAYLSGAFRGRGIPVKEEVSICSDLKRDADILLPHWDGAAGLAIDVGVCHPCPPSAGWTAEASARTLAQSAEKKVVKYEDRCRAQGARFAPFVLGVWGSFAPGASDLWLELQRRLAAHVTGHARSRYISELKQSLSLALVRGIAAQLNAMDVVLEAGADHAGAAGADALDDPTGLDPEGTNSPAAADSPAPREPRGAPPEAGEDPEGVAPMSQDPC